MTTVDARESFTVFAREVEPRLRYALTAALGQELGHEAAAEAMAYGWEHWGRLDERSLCLAAQRSRMAAGRNPGHHRSRSYGIQAERCRGQQQQPLDGHFDRCRGVQYDTATPVTDMVFSPAVLARSSVPQRPRT